MLQIIMRATPPPQFFLSILTAIVTGIGVAYIGIMSVQIVAKPELVARALSAISDSRKAVESRMLSFSEKNDPIFINFFSRGVSYAAEASEESGEDITLTGEFLSAPSNSASYPVTAKAYSVMSLDKGNVLVEKDADRLLPIASVTKLATAAVARIFFEDDDIIEITPSALATEGTTGRFRVGEKYKLKEILYPLLIVSSNDAASAIAEAYDEKHGRGAFVKEMNNWASSIGAYRTYFRDPSGLSAENVSTANDLSIMARWIFEHDEEIFDVTLTKAKTVRTRTWVNPTHFLSLSSYNGGKNGFTTEAKLTNVSLFSLGSPKRLYSVVLLGSSQRDKDTLTLLNQAVK